MARLADEMEALIRAAQGRAFVLRTAWDTLRQVGQQLKQRLPWHVWLQGESGSRDALLRRFRHCGNAVLLGTASFWEGVDVRGAALSCVVIDKLPFAAPDDPLLRARAALMQAAGINPFVADQLPAAVLALKQGAGRLIRAEGDRGVLMVCDPRLLQRSYGRIFLKNLPGMPVVCDLGEVQRFFTGVAAGERCGVAR